MPESEASDLQGEAYGPDSAVAKEHILNFVRAIAAVISVSPLFAQYGGPAILARGQSPGTMSATQIDFRPFISLMGTYDSGLNGVAVDANGTPVNDASYGVSVNFGVSGFHSWKHTRIGLDYAGGFSHYAKSFYDGVNAQSLLLSISHHDPAHLGVTQQQRRPLWIQPLHSHAAIDAGIRPFHDIRTYQRLFRQPHDLNQLAGQSGHSALQAAFLHDRSGWIPDTAPVIRAFWEQRCRRAWRSSIPHEPAHYGGRVYGYCTTLHGDLWQHGFAYTRGHVFHGHLAFAAVFGTCRRCQI